MPTCVDAILDIIITKDSFLLSGLRCGPGICYSSTQDIIRLCIINENIGNLLRVLLEKLSEIAGNIIV